MDELDGVGSFDTVPDTLGEATEFVGGGLAPGVLVSRMFEQLAVVELFATVNIKNGKGLVNKVFELAKRNRETSSFEVGGGIGLWAGSGSGTAWDAGGVQASSASGCGGGKRDPAGAHPRTCAEGWRLVGVEDRSAGFMDAAPAGLGTPCYVRSMRWAGRRQNPWPRGVGMIVVGQLSVEGRHSRARWGARENGHPRNWCGECWGRGKMCLGGGNEFLEFASLVIGRGM